MANKVVIDTELNSKPIVRSVSEIEKAMKKVEGEQDKLSAKMEKFGKLTGNEKSKAYKSMLYDAQRLDDKMSDLTNELVAARKVENDLAAKEKERLATLEKIASASKSASSAREGVRSASDKEGIREEAKKLFDARNSLINAINEFKSEGGDVTSEEFKGANEELAKIRNKILELKSSFNALSGNGTESKGIFSGLTRRMRIPGEQAEQGENTVSVLERIKSAANKAGNAIKGIGDNAKKSHSNTSRMLRTLFRYTIGIRSLFTLFNKLRSGVREGIDNMSKFNNAVNPVNDALSNIKSSLTYMKNSFASAFAPILTTITPAITALMDSVSEAMTKFGMFVAALNGQKTFIKATKVMEDYNQELKETNTQLGKLDELNNVDLSETTKAFDKANSQFEEVNIDEDMFGIAEAFKQGSLGKIIAEALNKGIGAIGEEGSKIDFEGIGEKIAGGINDFFKDFDFAKLATTLNTWVNGFLSTLSGIVNNIDWASVWDGAMTFLTNLDLSTIVTLVVGGFIIKNGIVGSTSLALSASEKILEKIGAAIGASGAAEFALSAAAVIGITKILSDIAADKKEQYNKELGEKLFGAGVSLSDKVIKLKEIAVTAQIRVSDIKVSYDTELGDANNTHSYVQDLIDKFFELKSKVSLTAEELTELKSLEDSIEAYIPGFTTIINDQTLSYDEQKAAVEELMNAKKTAFEREIAQKYLEKNMTSMMDFDSDIKNAKKERDKIYKEVVDMFGGDTQKAWNFLTEDQGNWEKIYGSLFGADKQALRDSWISYGEQIRSLEKSFDSASESANELYKTLFGSTSKYNIFAGYILGADWESQEETEYYKNYINAEEVLKDFDAEKFVESVGEKVGNAGQVIGGVFTNAFGNSVDLNGAVKDSAVELKDGLATPGNSARSKLYQSGQVAGSAHLLGMGNKLVGTSGVVSNALKGAKTNPAMLSNAASLGAFVGAKTATSINTKTNQNKATTDLVSLYEAGAKDTEKKVSNKFSTIGKALSDIGKSIAEGVKNGIVLKKNIFLDALLSLVPENLRQMFSTGLLGAVTAAEIVTTSTGSGGGGSSSYNRFMPDYRSMDLGIPYLASGAVIPPNREFLAVLGDQKAGTNVEAPLSTIQEAVRNEMKNMKVTVEVVPDKSGIFKAVRVAAQEYTATTGNYAF